MAHVIDMYNKLALITGFPEYTNETDTPDTTRFLLNCLSEGLHSLINNIYIQNNVLERTDTIVTTAGKELYGLEGIIKDILLVDSRNNKVRKIGYMDNVNPNYILEGNDKKPGEPTGYLIQKGYLRLYPVPDKAYTLKVTVSTSDLVWANDDSSRGNIESIYDTVIADNKFCDLVVLRAAVIVFTRANNALAQVYSELQRDALNDYLEHDFKSLEANRFFDRSAGHYSPRRGLLD